MATKRSFDVIIVGSGFGGAVCAARLAEKGMRVLILERGPWWGPLQRSRPAPDRRELPRGALGFRKLFRNLRLARKGRRAEWLFNKDGLLEVHSFERLNSLTASGVGGGSHVYTNILEEPPPGFFDAFPDEITAQEMRPYYERVRRMLRPAPIPAPRDKDRVFERALETAGLPAPAYPPLGVAWGSSPDRPETVTNAAGIEQSTSTYRSDVFVGCEDGSKTTLDLTYVPVALQHETELRPLCEVLSIGSAKRGYWVRYRDHRVGKEHSESAPRLVLAAGGLNTQRLLFDSRDRLDSTQDPRRLPELPQTLGRHFSPNADFVALLWRSAILEDSSHGPSVGALARVTEERGHRYQLGELGPPTGALPLPEFLRRRLASSTFLFSMGRDASSGTIGFDGKGLTSFIDRSFDSELYEEMEKTMERVAHHYRPKRLFSNFLSGRGSQGLFTVHPLGGCSIGRSSRDGFTNHRGEVFGHPGLFVADGSLYPQSPGIAPSLTIAALAERQANLMD